MHVIVPLPSGWHATTVHGVSTFIAPPPRELAIHVGALVVCPEDVAAWEAAKQRADLQPIAIVTAAGDAQFATTTGWPAKASRFVVTAPSGALVEHRLVVTYRFLHTIAAVLVRSRRAVEELVAADVRGALESAEPEFRGDEPIALSELWTLD